MIIVRIGSERSLEKSEGKSTNTKRHLEIYTITKSKILEEIVSNLFRHSASLSIAFTRFRRGSCLVPAGRGGVVFLNIDTLQQISNKNNQTSDLFAENFFHRSVLIFLEICHSCKLDMWDCVREFLAIDECMANRRDDHRGIEQHLELFPGRSE